MAAKDSVAIRFMNLTGKLRFFLGPADRAPVDTPVTAENQALLEQQVAQTTLQWAKVTRADGSVYYLERGQ